MAFAATVEQTEFDDLVWVSRPLLRIDEVCAILRLKKDAIYEIVELGRLEAHQDSKRAGSQYRITRRSVVAYLAQTAQYDPDHFIEIVFGLARRLDRRQRGILLQKIQTL